MLSRRQVKRIEALLDQCSRHLEYGVVFVSVDSALSPAGSDNLCRFCDRCLRSTAAEMYCRRSIISGAYQALQTGEPYFYRCWAGLSSVVLPVAPGGTLEGGLETGGFFYPGEGEEVEQFVRHAMEALPKEDAGILEPVIEEIPLRPGLDVRGTASFIMEALFSSGINDVDHFHELQERYLLQCRIGALMQDYGGSESSFDTGLFDVFSTLTQACATKNRQQIMLTLDEFFSRVLLSTSLNQRRIKAHIHVLLAVLARGEVLRGDVSLQQALSSHFLGFRELEPLTEVEDICYWTFKRVTRYVDQLQSLPVEGQSTAKKAIAWIEANYWRRATLAMAGKAIGASVSAAVQALKRDTGKTFHQHLLEVRLREARNRLAETDDPIAAVAINCGFCDQSHLTRCFKKEFGMTPRQYRQLSAGSRAALID